MKKFYDPRSVLYLLCHLVVLVIGVALCAFGKPISVAIGTSLIAAERAGRRFRGCDIDPAYVDVAVERWVQMTGGTPRLERPE